MGLDYRTIGVDTRPGSSTDLASMVEAGAVTKAAADRLSPGSIGCALSHQAIYRTMVDEDIPLALVIEDDAILAPNLADLLADPAPFLRDDRVTMLFYSHHGDAEFLVSTQDSIPLGGSGTVRLPLDGNFRSTVGYLVTRRAAGRLMTANYPIRFPADGWDQYLYRKALTCMQIVDPAPVGHPDDAPSTRRPAAATTTWSSQAKATLKRWLRPGTTPLVVWLRKEQLRKKTEKIRTPILVDRPSPFREPAPLDPALD
jgi:GR25 family glycosyltransferase involved in LPS biosynthesis